MNGFAFQQHGRAFLRTHRRIEARLRPNAAYQTMAVTAPPTTSPGVVVMTIPACPYCRRAKAALMDAHIPFQELDASIDPELRSLVRQLSGSRTVPQVFVGGYSFGGSDELAEGLASGSFQAAVAEAAAAGKAPLPEAISQRVDQVAQERLAAASAAAAAAQEAAEAAVAAAAVAAAVTGTWSGAEARPLAPVALASVNNLSGSGSGSGSGSTWSGSESGEHDEPRQPVDIQAIRLQGVMELMTDPVAGIPRKPRRIGGRPQFPTFSGQDLLDWISRFGVSAPPASIASRSTSAARQWLSQHCYTSAGAAAAGAQLLAANRISVACDNLPPVSQESPTAVTMASMDDVLGDSWDSMTYAAVSDMPQVDVNAQYVIVGEVPMLLKGQPLNTTYWWNGRARAASQVAQDLRELIMQLYDKHLSADGRAVNYQGIKQDPLFSKYMAATAELQRIELDSLSREELCALFINLYNALIIHALVVYGPPTSTTQRMSFFTKDASYCVAGQTYSADDMENGVLRGNRPAASNLLVLVGANKLAGGQFKKSDPRARKIVVPMDPRIHFALVCGAKSCPPISIYTPDNLDEGLAAAGEAFCSSEVEVDVPNRTVTLSKIFQWYSVDFGENDTEKLKFVLQFLKGKPAEGLGTLLDSGKPIKVQYKAYNWDLNQP